MKKIISILKGVGEGSLLFQTSGSDRYDVAYEPHAQTVYSGLKEIRPFWKRVEISPNDEVSILVYECYSQGGSLLFEIESNSSLIIEHEREKPF